MSDKAHTYMHINKYMYAAATAAKSLSSRVRLCATP